VTRNLSALHDVLVSVNKPSLAGLAVVAPLMLVACGSSAQGSPAALTATATPTVTATPTPSPAPSPTPTAAPTPTPTSGPTSFPVAGHIVVTSLGISAPFTASCGDDLSYVPTGSTICYWNFTSPGGGYFEFAGSTTGPLAVLSHAHAGAVVTWTVAATTYVRKLSGTGQVLPRDPATGQFGGHGVPPGQHVFLEVRSSTQEVEYDGAP